MIKALASKARGRSECSKRTAMKATRRQDNILSDISLALKHWHWSARGIAHVHCTDGVKLQKGWQWKKHGAKAIFQSDRIEMLRFLQSQALAITIDCVCQDYCSEGSPTTAWGCGENGSQGHWVLAERGGGGAAELAENS